MSYKKIQFPYQNTQFWNPRVSLYSVFSLAALTLDTNVRVSVKLPNNINAFTFRSKSWNCHQTVSGFSSIVEVSVTFLLGVRLYMQTAFERDPSYGENTWILVWTSCKPGKWFRNFLIKWIISRHWSGVWLSVEKAALRSTKEVKQNYWQ